MNESSFERPTHGSLSAPPAPQPVERPRRAVFPWLLALVAVAFALGIVANPWFERTVRSRLPGMMRGATDEAAIEVRLNEQERMIAALRQRGETAPPSAPRAAAALPDDASQAARIDALVAEVAELRARAEANSGRIDAAVAGAAEGAAQARTVLLVTAVRRMIDSGQPIGVLEPVLRHSFADRPDLVEAIAALGTAPTAPERLRASFARLHAQAEDVRDGGWWESLRSGLANIVAVRRADAAGMEANWRAAEARLAAGDVGGAAAIAVRLPGTAAWLADARRYLNGQRALAQLEVEVLTAPVAVPPVAPAEVQDATAAPL